MWCCFCLCWLLFVACCLARCLLCVRLLLFLVVSLSVSVFLYVVCRVSFVVCFVACYLSFVIVVVACCLLFVFVVVVSRSSSLFAVCYGFLLENCCLLFGVFFFVWPVIVCRLFVTCC